MTQEPTYSAGWEIIASAPGSTAPAHIDTYAHPETVADGVCALLRAGMTSITITPRTAPVIDPKDVPPTDLINGTEKLRETIKSALAPASMPAGSISFANRNIVVIRQDEAVALIHDLMEARFRHGGQRAGVTVGHMTRTETETEYYDTAGAHHERNPTGLRINPHPLGNVENPLGGRVTRAITDGLNARHGKYARDTRATPLPTPDSEAARLAALDGRFGHDVRDIPDDVYKTNARLRYQNGFMQGVLERIASPDLPSSILRRDIAANALREDHLNTMFHERDKWIVMSRYHAPVSHTGVFMTIKGEPMLFERYEDAWACTESLRADGARLAYVLVPRDITEDGP